MRAMRWIWLSTAYLASAARSSESETNSPFVAPANAETNNQRAFDVLQLLKRTENNCPGGYNPCSKLGNADACCQDGTICSRDSANNIACCPTGVSCTGSLTAEPSATDGSSFRFPHAATATTTTSSSAAGAQITGSTLTGAYPFIYVPTTFDSPQTCSSYYHICQSEYSQCTGALMGRYGVTVGGAGGAGVTVESITDAAQATSVCSSLSASACHGLELGYCGALPSGGAQANGNGNNAATPGRTTSLHDLALGIMVGVAGMFI
ncbi:uncharacterized protein PFLUO_LOCUS8978 [Penicillium psychrofluorescens]|uniref:uncharacterized protein n=1 Tax=Penicillium psychrofluorescens TaxID=3158075 RepID=UPI003CCDCA55